MAFSEPEPKYLQVGKNGALATINGISVTPTRTIYSLSAGPMQLNLTFLSPIEPHDLTLQSFPFGYVYVDAVSSDGRAHNVQIYSDLTGEWLSDNVKDPMSWDTTTTDSAVFHSAQLASPDKLANGYIARDGVLYHATLASSGMTWQTGNHSALRPWWIANGSLNNTKDQTDSQRINDKYPVIAFANDLGTITATSQPVVWAIGYVRTPVVSLTGSQELQPYWTTTYSQIDDGIQAFLIDFSNAKSRAEILDDKILSEARKVSPNYADLVSLSARQTFGGVETAVSSSGSARMFMKDVGISQRVNPVEVIYASLPAYLYINATWGRYLLEPLLENQQSSLYAAPDLGVNYPIVQGGASNRLRAIEDSGSMLIMTWAQARFSGDQTLLLDYYDTLKTWTDNVISANAVVPSGYQDADGLTSTNLTNLALKGIIGVRAMAEISHTLGKGDDASKYQSQASQWIEQWEKSASLNGHLVSSYNAGGSWGMIYNLFADKLLGMNLVSQEVYDEQDAFYSNLLKSANKFGLSFDSSTDLVKYRESKATFIILQCGLSAYCDGAEWTFLTAATTKDSSTREELLRSVHEKAQVNPSAAFSSTYDAKKNVSSGFSSLPSQLAGLSGNTVVGGTGNKKPAAGAIAGGVIGGLAGLAIVIIGSLLWMRRKKSDQVQPSREKESIPARYFGRLGSMNSILGRNDRHSPANPDIESLGTLTLGDHSQRTQLGHYYNNSQSSTLPTRSSDSKRTNLPSSLPNPSSPTEILSSRYTMSDIATSLGAPERTNSDVSALRGEVEHLRRNMEEIRTRTVYEPPPSYTAQ
ncbi:hypothetical protein VNI00_007602 [Paramarasmius palmivorus]|uniref:DUF1793-domain-containing protein n=1 Tax=Paramarasmius palmivorus TaxID=297713 RepID=A0AAW0CZP8_9AGAR